MEQTIEPNGLLTAKQVFLAPFSQTMTDLDEIWQGTGVALARVQFDADRCVG